MQLFLAYVYSKIVYGLHCYGTAHKNVLNLLHVICNKLLKILFFRDYTFPTDLLYKECKILKIEDMTKFLAIKFVHRYVYPDMYTPEQLKYYYTLNIDIHDVNVRNKLKVRLPGVNTVLGETCLHWYGGHYWNSLDKEIVEERDLSKFKYKLKDFFLSRY